MGRREKKGHQSIDHMILLGIVAWLVIGALGSAVGHLNLCRRFPGINADLSDWCWYVTASLFGPFNLVAAWLVTSGDDE